MRKVPTLLGVVAVALLVTAAASPAAKKPAAAPAEERVLLNAPHVVIDPKTHHADLTLDYLSAKFYNPASGRNEDVVLRTFIANTAAVDRAPAGIRDASPKPFIAPTIEVKPGDTLKITLHNKLQPQDKCETGVPHMNVPHCFNTTNLHMHGLWVSPEPPSDYVLASVKPQESREYVYNIPVDHPGGTLWYHPHMHGSTALQVGGGAAGVLIVRGVRKPAIGHPGEIDTLLTSNVVKERVFVFQQIQYACFKDAPDGIVDEDQKPYYDTIKAYKDKTWLCEHGDKGQIKGYSQLGFDPATGLEKWSVSGRFTTINGETMPTFESATVGKLERWRMVDAGLVDTVSVVVREMARGAKVPDKGNSYANAQWVAQNCTGTVVHQYAIANDGLTRDAIVDRDEAKPTMFQPGYRQDVLLAFPHAGRYCVVDLAGVGLSTSLTGKVQRAQLLGVVNVGRGDVKPFTDQTGFVRGKLIDAARAAGYDKATTEAVVADLKNTTAMQLSLFAAHPSLVNVPVNGHQELAFNIANNPPNLPPGLNFMVGDSFDDSTKDRPYNPSQWRIVYLGDVDEWKLTSRVGGHPFHIHVNPFQVISIKNPSGVEVSVTGEPDRDSTKADMQYADLQGTWKDTLFVKQGYTVLLRTQYREFTGRFVLHCHILDHEDQGMMENIEIVRRGDKPLSSQPDKMGDMKM